MIICRAVGCGKEIKKEDPCYGIMGLPVCEECYKNGVSTREGCFSLLLNPEFEVGVLTEEDEG